MHKLLAASGLVLALATTAASSAFAAPAPASSTGEFSALEWRNIGPFRGGRATAVAGIAGQPFTFFMGSAGGGVWETTDAGVNWSNVSDGFFKYASVGAIAIAPSDANVIYVGTGEATARANTVHRGDGAYKSTDGGKTWTHIGLDMVDEISRIVVDPHDANVVYVAAQGPLYAPSQQRGVFRSTDGGATWKRVLFTGETNGPSDLAMDPKDPKVLYAAMWDHQRFPWEIRAFGPGSGLYKSVDGGESWTKLTNGLPAAGVGKISVSTTRDRVYALVSTQSLATAGLYVSDDAGKTWTLVNNNHDLTRRTWYFTKVFADPTDPQTVWVADLSLHRSTDGGKTFTHITPPHGDHHELWINPLDHRFVAEADDGGATVSLDGGKTWSAQDNQPTAQFYRVSADGGFPYHLYGGQQDNTSVDIATASTERAGIGQHDWRPAAGSENSFVDVDPDKPGVSWASGSYLGQMDEFDANTGVNRITSPRPVLYWGNSPSPLLTYRYVLNTPMFKSRHEAKTLYIGAQMLLASDDDGVTWREVGPDVTRRGNDPKAPQHLGTGETGDGVYGAIDYAAESPIKAGVLWTASDDGMVAVTPDNGKTWRKSALPGVPDARINAVDPSPHDLASAYVAATRFQFDDTKPYLFKTKDWGKTWARIGADLPSWTRVVREDPVRPGLLYAGTETGVFVSFDDGESWRPLQSKLPITPINDLLLHNGDLIAATSGRGFWVLDDVSALQQLDAKSETALYRPRVAYRASFGAAETYEGKSYGKNPPAGAILDFHLAAAGPATIEIVDTSGAVIRKLPVHGEFGLNRVVWNLRETATPVIADGLVFGGGNPQGRLAPPGTYTVRLAAGGSTQSQPLEIAPAPGSHAPSRAYADADGFLKEIEADMAAFHDPALLANDARRQLGEDGTAIKDPALLTQVRQLEAKLKVDYEVYGDIAFLQVKNNQAVPVDQPTSRELFAKLHPELTSQVAALNQALGPDLAALNARLVAAGQKPVEPKLPAPPKSRDGED